ncbi:NADPH-dependent F420 reductase [Mycobacteroides chelonae]|uniref:NADPH-dependent F420 reductase n=1 Tax=Mycobacteroides chelonae TaxID=1774 RepID=UPI0008A96B8F|nr:NAD(P)-binding domain-containing protein [Mycobacteroides chelonae]OHU64941.1 NADP oxidoreductase [Mycobacteroides chelonae]
MDKVGIIGAGILGGTLARALAKVGYPVSVANSRGPQTLSDIATDGITAGWISDVAQSADILFLALPYSAVAAVAPTVRARAEQAIIVDTGNYYPGRDGQLPSWDQKNPVPDTLWVSTQLDQPVYKLFNNITYIGLRDGGLPEGDPARIGLPVAGQDGPAKAQLFALVDRLGFDPVDGGTLEQSWRQQPGSPIYATDLPAADIRQLLEGATEHDAKTYRENREKFDEVTAGGYELIHSLRAQGSSLDEIIEAMAAETERAVSQVHDAQG